MHPAPPACYTQHLLAQYAQYCMGVLLPLAAARARSSWYGPQRPQLPASLGGQQPHLTGTVAGRAGRTVVVEEQMNEAQQSADWASSALFQAFQWLATSLWLCVEVPSVLCGSCN